MYIFVVKIRNLQVKRKTLRFKNSCMKIAGVEVGEQPLILAPMEDVTNPPFRKFCKRYGADWLYSEFVSADALVRSVNKSLKKLVIDEKERPVTIQIYGRFIDSMVEAAKIVEEEG